MVESMRKRISDVRRSDIVSGSLQIPDVYKGEEDYFEIEKSHSPLLMKDIENMISKEEGVSNGQFADFVEEMIMLNGGQGMKTREGKQVMIGSTIGSTLSGNSIELRRYFGEWTAPDVYCDIRKRIDNKVTAGSPLVFEEDVAVFSDNQSIPSIINRKIDTIIPGLISTGKSVTGEEIQLFRPIDLEATKGLNGQQLALIANNIYNFYLEQNNSQSPENLPLS